MPSVADLTDTPTTLQLGVTGEREQRAAGWVWSQPGEPQTFTFQLEDLPSSASSSGRTAAPHCPRLDSGRRMKGLRWHYTRLVRGLGQERWGEASSLAGWGARARDECRQVMCSSSESLPSWPGIQRTDSGTGGLRWQPHGAETSRSTACYSVSSSLEQVPGGALSRSPKQLGPLLRPEPGEQENSVLFISHLRGPSCL